MSYQVLARKWRPRTFREMVGQEHVLQALINALDHDRLHHAYLFTGTRGVGKTTIARILAKCLNCEVGVSSVPCNECSSCIEINEGRFVDLIEVDAASRTKVEDTRELLENVQYAPTRGRYKVYLIDEVHMLSNSSFNALLKTLEEPPPHVKFLLATTDPQKLPVTILSRCLQFNLKNMNPERIVSHLQFVLEKEMVPFEDAGLWQLARSADGSMRDALSLTDQSIAFGDGKITDNDVRIMLGTIDQSLVYDVLNGLIAEDIQQMLTAVANLSEHAPDYSAALAELIATLHRIAIAQALPEAVDNSQGDRQQIYDFAQAMSAEDVQLYYQTALLGRRDLPLVPDPRSGFEMVLLRMLAFKPQGVNQLPKAGLAAQSTDITPQTGKESDQHTETTVATAAEHSHADEQHDVANHVTDDGAYSVTDNNGAENDSVANNSANAGIADLPSTNNAQAPQIPETSQQPQTSSEPSPSPVDNTPSSEPSPVSAPPQTAASSEDEYFFSVVETTEEQPQPTMAGGESPVKKSETATAVAEEKPLAENKEPSADNKELSAESKEPSAENKEPSAENKEPDVDTQESSAATKEPAAKRAPKITWSALNADTWFNVYNGIDTGGLLQSTVANCALVQWGSSHLEFILDHQQSTLYDTKHQQYLADLLSDYFGQPIDVTITLGDVPYETPSQIVIRQRQERQVQAEAAIASDPVVQQLQDTMGGRIVPDSIKPID